MDLWSGDEYPAGRIRGITEPPLRQAAYYTAHDSFTISKRSELYPPFGKAT
jgi:hypothetical protein